MQKDKIIAWIKQYRNRIVAALLIVLVLVIAFCSGEKQDSGSASRQELVEVEATDKSLSKEATDEAFTQETSQETQSELETANYAEETTNSIKEPTDNSVTQAGADLSQTQDNIRNTNETDSKASQTESAAPQETTVMQETTAPQETTAAQPQSGSTNTESQKQYCTISISCANVLNNMDKLDKDKKDIIPKDGWILKPITVELKENETVFDLLKRICIDKKIHMEFSWTPLYNSAYIEGIYNLYEFDCGSLSGWMYSVNGEYFNYGSSKAVVQNGDVITWVFTCDLGNDVKN